jgi:hypothetical protein
MDEQLLLELGELRGRVLAVLGLNGSVEELRPHQRYLAGFLLLRCFGLPRNAVAQILSCAGPTVNHGVTAVTERMSQRPAYRAEVERMINTLRPPHMRRA